MNEQKQNQDNDVVSRLAVILGIIGAFLFGLIVKGAFRKSTWTKNTIRFWLLYPLYISLFVFSRSWDIPLILDTSSWIFPKGLGEWVYFHISPRAQLVLLTVVPFLLWLAFKGAWTMIKLHRYQKALAYLGLKPAAGQKLAVVDVISTSPGQKKMILSAIGFDIADIRAKKAVLESSLNVFVQDIRVSKSNRQVIEVLASDRELPNLIPYDEVATRLVEPFSFLVGEGMNGLIVASLLKVHHLLVAGASGGGKSFFVKQLLVGLLQSSSHIQFYLLDLKKGVEMKVFERLKNVFIAKNSVTAIEALDAVVKEMDRRFDYLEKNGFTEMDCKRDKLDRIVVLVDEASELFTVVRSSKAIKESAENARELADKIAKLGRVAGIHLILATQKVVKETIDTRVQTNINARMIFRVNTTASSMTVLGNKLASDLPEIKGRGIWSVGSKDLVVQAPKLDNEEVAAKVALFAQKFNGEDSPLFQKMLNTKEPKTVRRAEGSAAAPDDGVNVEAGVF